MLSLIGGLAPLLREHPLGAFAALFAAGVATSLTPCIYPMIPITAGVIAGASSGARSTRTAVGLTLTYAVGMALLYAMLGLLAGLSGSLFGTVSSSPWARLAVGNLLLVFALGMLDVIPMTAPVRLLTWAANLKGGSYPAAFIMGATSGVVAAPCGAPAFAAVLTWVAVTRSGVLGFAYLFVFALGILGSNLPLNYALMRRPITGASPVSLRDYFAARGGLHAWGVLGGLIWGVGTVSNFVASYAQMIGPATSYALGQGATMVSALWGVFVWKEFRGAGPAAIRLLTLMFVFFILGLAGVALAPLVK